MRSSTFPRSGALILGSTFIESLLPSTLISQADSLLESHRIDEAIHLADQQRRRLQGKTVGDPDEVQWIISTLSFTDLRIIYS
jgi:hypothetical protein